jgi:hypothetical protein
MDSRDFHFPDHLVESGVIGTGFTGNVYCAKDTYSGRLVSCLHSGGVNIDD